MSEKIKFKGKKRDLIPLLQICSSNFGSMNVTINFNEYWNFAAATDVVELSADIQYDAQLRDKLLQCMKQVNTRESCSLLLCSTGEVLEKSKKEEGEVPPSNSIVRESYKYESVKLDAFDDMELYEEKLKGNFT